jgi:hypothetical protein
MQDVARVAEREGGFGVEGLALRLAHGKPGRQDEGRQCEQQGETEGQASAHDDPPMCTAVGYVVAVPVSTA